MQDETSHVFLCHCLEVIRILITAFIRADCHAIASSRLTTHRMVSVGTLIETNLLVLPANAAILRL